MQPDALTAFLNARLDEWEGLARQALPWQTGSRDEGQPAEHVSWRRSAGSVEFGIRHAGALRAILNIHRLQATKEHGYLFDPYTGERNLPEYQVTCDNCGWASSDPTSGCATLRTLAAVYSNHPDYRPEWTL